MVNRSAMSPPYLRADAMHVTRLQPVLMSKSATGEWSAPPLTRFNRDEMHSRASDENRCTSCLRLHYIIVQDTTANSLSDRVAGYRLTRQVGPRVAAIRRGKLASTACKGDLQTGPASGVHTRLALDPPPSLVVPRFTSPR